MAFDAYYAMGARRDLQELLRNLQGTDNFPDGPPTYSTIKKWSMANHWQARCKQRDIENSSKQHKKTDREVVNTKAAYRVEIGETREQLSVFRQRSEKLIADATDAIEKKEIKISTIGELNQVISSLKQYHDLNKDYVKLDLGLIHEVGEISGDITVVTAIQRPEDWKDGD